MILRLQENEVLIKIVPKGEEIIFETIKEFNNIFMPFSATINNLAKPIDELKY